MGQEYTLPMTFPVIAGIFYLNAIKTGDFSISNHNICHTKERHTRKNDKGLIWEIGEYKRVGLITHHYVNQTLIF